MGKWLSEHKSISIGTGVSVLTTIAGLFSDRLKQHPYILLSLFLCGIAMIVAPLLHSILFKHDRPSDGISADENSKSHIDSTDNSGVLAGRDANVAKRVSIRNVENYYDHSKPDVLDVPQAISPKQEPPNLGIDFEVKSRWAEVVYDQLPGRWRVANQSDRNVHKAFLVIFTRPLPLKGEKANPPIELQAHIKIGFMGGSSEQNKHSYWLGQVENKIWFSAGHEETVVVGMIEGPHFATYENPFEMGHGDFSVPVRTLGERKIAMHMGRSVEVTISLFDSHKNCTVEQVQFSVSAIQGLPMAVKK